jgi:hypothetical protein
MDLEGVGWLMNLVEIRKKPEVLTSIYLHE